MKPINWKQIGHEIGSILTAIVWGVGAVIFIKLGWLFCAIPGTVMCIAYACGASRKVE